MISQVRIQKVIFFTVLALSGLGAGDAVQCYESDLDKGGLKTVSCDNEATGCSTITTKDGKQMYGCGFGSAEEIKCLHDKLGGSTQGGNCVEAPADKLNEAENECKKKHENVHGDEALKDGGLYFGGDEGSMEYCMCEGDLCNKNLGRSAEGDGNKNNTKTDTKSAACQMKEQGFWILLGIAAVIGQKVNAL